MLTTAGCAVVSCCLARAGLQSGRHVICAAHSIGSSRDTQSHSGCWSDSGRIHADVTCCLSQVPYATEGLSRIGLVQVERRDQLKSEGMPAQLLEWQRDRTLLRLTLAREIANLQTKLTALRALPAASFPSPTCAMPDAPVRMLCHIMSKI